MCRPILDESRIHPTIRNKIGPTFPMVFVKGVLVGGASDLAKLIKSGELKGK